MASIDSWQRRQLLQQAFALRPGINEELGRFYAWLEELHAAEQGG